MAHHALLPLRSAGLCIGVKVLLAGEQQAAVTVAVEGLMDGKPLPELESFLTLDPKVILPGVTVLCALNRQSLQSTQSEWLASNPSHMPS